MNLFFYIFSFLSIISTFFTVIITTPVYLLLSFLFSIISISGVFISLGSWFIGALEIIIYAGAILVLFIFILMMLNVLNIDEYHKFNKINLSAFFLFFLFSFVLIFLFSYILSMFSDQKINYIIFNITRLGIDLFNSYVLAVEISSIILLSAIVIIFHIGKQSKNS
ncbi:NADH-quinone oxidoreductase subunit J [Buchnera aphidicola (Neophyllaphis podocarpi)]|uniref:NADH-quinone oxidoreductase subunit J family protein n=1 Tax=Buchnera aphidicola TaxID=9 RepID=UPI003463C19B